MIAAPRSARVAIAADVRRTFSSPLSLIWLALICLPIVWIVSRDALFAYPLSAFGTAMSSPVSLALPLIAVVVYLLHFSREIQDRFIVYTRTRDSIGRILLQKFVANAIAVFAVFFSYAFITFIFTIWIAPAAGWLKFDLAGYGPNYADPSQFVRLGEVWGVSPALFGLVYAIWCGVNGVIWASVGFSALLLLPNRYVALSVPFVASIILTIGSSLVGLDIYAPYPLWILFGYEQSAPWTALVPIAVLTIAAGTLLGVVLIRRQRLEKLQ